MQCRFSGFSYSGEVFLIPHVPPNTTSSQPSNSAISRSCLRIPEKTPSFPSILLLAEMGTCTWEIMRQKESVRMWEGNPHLIDMMGPVLASAEIILLRDMLLYWFESCIYIKMKGHRF